MRKEKKPVDVDEVISLNDLIKQYERMAYLQECSPVPYYKKTKDDSTLKKHQRTRSTLHWLKMLQGLLIENLV